jgi:hypothetical protein
MPRPKKPDASAAPWDPENPDTFPVVTVAEFNAITRIVASTEPLADQWVKRAHRNLLERQAGVEAALPAWSRPKKWTARQEARHMFRMQIIHAVQVYREADALNGRSAPTETAIAAQLGVVARSIRDLLSASSHTDFWTRQALDECGWGGLESWSLANKLGAIEERAEQLRCKAKKIRPKAGRRKDDHKILLVSALVKLYASCTPRERNEWKPFVCSILTAVGVTYPNPAKRPREFKRLIEPTLLDPSGEHLARVRVAGRALSRTPQ